MLVECTARRGRRISSSEFLSSSSTSADFISDWIDVVAVVDAAAAVLI